jgi:hypothetical protein
MESQNCWEYWDCPEEDKENCPAYTTNSGRDCFYMAESFCPKKERDFQYCWECPWYEKVTIEH